MENVNNPLRAKVDLITGFLGAGKTTFVKKYMKYLGERGISYAVIENEFGAAGVDAALIGGNVFELSGGCICCGQKVNFHNLIIELAAHAERIIVEPSGVFNADDFFDIMDSPQVQQVAECGLMAGVVDPCALSDLTEQDARVLFGELVCAGALLISRTDRADSETLLAAREYLSALLPALPPVMDAAAVDFGALMACRPVRRAHERMYADHSALFQSAFFFPDSLFDAPSLRRAALQLLSGEAGDVLRVKGSVRSENGFLSLNAAGEDIEILPSSGQPGLNIIGRRLNRKKIKAILTKNSLQEDSQP